MPTVPALPRCIAILALPFLLSFPTNSSGATRPGVPPYPPVSMQRERPGWPRQVDARSAPSSRALRAPRSPIVEGARRAGPALDAPPVEGCGQWGEWFPDSLALSREGHALIYDSAAQRLVMFGGFDDYGQASADVWTMNLTGTPAWSHLQVTGSPSARTFCTAIHDAARNRMVVYGGYSENQPELSQAWALTLGATPTWTDITPTGAAPPYRYFHTAVYDASRDRMVIFGGISLETYEHLDDVWAFSLSTDTWTQLTPAGSPPSKRAYTNAIYDSPRDRMIVFGGWVDDQGSGPNSDEVWSLAFAGAGTWSLLAPGGTAPPALAGHSAVFDTPRNRMIVFGGCYVTGAGDSWMCHDAWSLTLAGTPAWSKLSTSGAVPPVAVNHAAVYDPVRQRMQVFGGFGPAGGETWSLTLSGSPSWSEFTVQTVPRWREGSSLVIDAPRQRLVLFGGGYSAPLGDTWVHSLSGPGSWTRIYTSGDRPYRRFHTAIYDSVGQRMIVYGGWNERSQLVNDVWALSLSGTPAWSRLDPSGAPPIPGERPGGAYDRLRRRLMVFGGNDSLGGRIPSLHALSLAGSGAWSEVVAGGDAPDPLFFSSCIYDVPRDRVVVVGSYDYTYRAHVWALPLGAGGTWTHTSPGPDAPDYYDWNATTADPARDRLLMIDNNANVFVLRLAGVSWNRLGVAGERPPFNSAPRIAVDSPANRMFAMGSLVTTGIGLTNALRVFENATGAYSLDVQPAPSFGGTVMTDVSGECVPEGVLVTIEAMPGAGFGFAGWSGDASGTVNPLTITMDRSKRVQANFAQSPPACASWRILGSTSDQLPLDTPELFYDAAAVRLIAVGFGNATFGVEVWTMALDPPADWQRVPAGTVPELFSSLGSCVFDPVRNRILHYSMYGDLAGQLWQLPLSGTPAWSQVSIGGPGPPARSWGTAMYDPIRDRLIVFGGLTPNTFEYLGDVWALDLAGTPVWTDLAPEPGPAPRAYHRVTYDPIRDRMLVVRGVGGPYSDFLNDIWALSLAGTPSWSLVRTMNIPYGEPFPVNLAYDPVRDRAIFLFWPYTTFDDEPAVVRALTFEYGPQWVNLLGDGAAPPKLLDVSMVYDPLWDRLIVAGGYRFVSSSYTSNRRTYAMSMAGGVWLDAFLTPEDYGSIEVDPNVPCHAPGSVVTLNALPVDQREFAGWIGDVSSPDNPLQVTLTSNQVIGAQFRGGVVATAIQRFEAERTEIGVRITWSVTAEGAREVLVERSDAEAGPWQPLELGPTEDAESIAIDREAGTDRPWYYRLAVRVAGGATLHSQVVKVAAGVRVDRTGLAAVGPNPGASVRIEFTVAREQKVRLSVLDVTGREVAVLADGVHAVGRYTSRWGGGADGRGAGIYFLHFAAAGRTETRRIALIH